MQSRTRFGSYIKLVGSRIPVFRNDEETNEEEKEEDGRDDNDTETQDRNPLSVPSPPLNSPPESGGSLVQELGIECNATTSFSY